MTWVKVDDQFPDHPKAVALSDAAMAAWLRGLCYCSRYLTDGYIPEAVIMARLTGEPDAVDELLEAGLWSINFDGSVHVVDYCEHQRTRDEVNIHREKERERKAKARARAAEVKSRAVSQRDTARNPGHVRSTETESETEREERNTSAPSGAADEEFAAFWDAYPRRDGRKQGKQRAVKAWGRLSADDRRGVMLALENYKQSESVARGFAMDAARFIGPNAEWRDWTEAATHVVVAREGAQGQSPNGEEMRFTGGRWWIIRDGQRIPTTMLPVGVAS